MRLLPASASRSYIVVQRRRTKDRDWKKMKMATYDGRGMRNSHNASNKVDDVP